MQHVYYLKTLAFQMKWTGSLRMRNCIYIYNLTENEQKWGGGDKVIVVGAI